jgi:hypothetical protein
MGRSIQKTFSQYASASLPASRAIVALSTRLTVRRSDHSPLENSWLDRAGRRNAGLTIDDVKSEETRFHNLHARLTAAESAIRILQKDRSR